MAELLAANQITIAKVLDGKTGEDGYSPTVTTGTSSDGSTTVTVTNKDGSTTTILVDGKARADIDNLEIGGRNYYRPSQVVDLGCTGTNGGQLISTGACIGFYVKTTAGDVWSVSRYDATNNRFDYCFTIDEPANGVTIQGWNSANRNELKIEGIVIPDGCNYLFLYLSNQNDAMPNVKLEKGNRATDWTPAPEDVQAGVDSLNDTVFGVQTFEYILDGVTIPAHKREDGTYYYILNDEEVTVAEADLVHDSDGELTSYQEGGIYEALDGMSKNIGAIDTKVNSFDARETAIYNAIQDNSLIARKNARVEGNSLIITNDTVTEDIASLLNYLQLNSDSIVIYGNGKDIVTIAKTADDSGYMKMNGTSMLQAQESKFSTMRMRSADGTGNLALVAGSDGHVSLREVLD